MRNRNKEEERQATERIKSEKIKGKKRING